MRFAATKFHTNMRGLQNQKGPGGGVTYFTRDAF